MSTDDQGIVLAAALLDELRARAAAEPARETCGLLLGTPQRIVAAPAARNVAADPARAFEIDPAVLLAAHKAARGGAPRVLGCYHSHPSGRAEPSPCDLAAAEPGSLWLILAGGEARMWRAEADTFREVALAIG